MVYPKGGGTTKVPHAHDTLYLIQPPYFLSRKKNPISTMSRSSLCMEACQPKQKIFIYHVRPDPSYPYQIKVKLTQNTKNAIKISDFQHIVRGGRTYGDL